MLRRLKIEEVRARLKESYEINGHLRELLSRPNHSYTHQFDRANVAERELEIVTLALKRLLAVVKVAKRVREPTRVVITRAMPQAVAAVESGQAAVSHVKSAKAMRQMKTLRQAARTAK
jgi:hypothetical protein